MRCGLHIIGALIAFLTLTACVQIVRNSGQTTLLERQDGTLRVATLNVHYIVLRRDTGAWSVADWEQRKPGLNDAFQKINADVFAFQEMESFAGGDLGDVNLTMQYLLEQNSEYRAAAVGDPAAFPSTQPIFYHENRLKLIDQGWFFFSDTPDVIYSRTFNGSYPAFASWARFETAWGEQFRVVNVHFEYKSRSNRLHSAHLVAERIAPWVVNGENIILAGDINARHGSETQRILTASGLQFTAVQGATYHFDRGINLFGAIDHIGATDGFVALGDPMVLRYKFSGDWPSDHYPVVVDYTLAASRP